MSSVICRVPATQEESEVHRSLLVLSLGTPSPNPDMYLLSSRAPGRRPLLTGLLLAALLAALANRAKAAVSNEFGEWHIHSPPSCRRFCRHHFCRSYCHSCYNVMVLNSLVVSGGLLDSVLLAGRDFMAANAAKGGVVTLAATGADARLGLQYKVLKAGSGKHHPVGNSLVKFHFEGRCGTLDLPPPSTAVGRRCPMLVLAARCLSCTFHFLKISP